MVVPCDKLVEVNKVEGEWGVDLDPELLDLIDTEYHPATETPWLKA
jgi:hypothetical protein